MEELKLVLWYLIVNPYVEGVHLVGKNEECSQRSSQQKVGGSALNMWSVNTLGDIRVEMYNTESGA